MKSCLDDYVHKLDIAVTTRLTLGTTRTEYHVNDHMCGTDEMMFDTGTVHFDLVCIEICILYWPGTYAGFLYYFRSH